MPKYPEGSLSEKDKLSLLSKIVSSTGVVLKPTHTEDKLEGTWKNAKYKDPVIKDQVARLFEQIDTMCSNIDKILDEKEGLKEVPKYLSDALEEINIELLDLFKNKEKATEEEHNSIYDKSGKLHGDLGRLYSTLSTVHDFLVELYRESYPNVELDSASTDSVKKGFQDQIVVV